MAFTIENPHFLPGNISGAGMERTPNGRVVDTRYAVSVDFIDGCLIEHPQPGNPMYALSLAGYISEGGDRARCLFLLTAEGAGILIDRIIGLAGMIGPEFRSGLLARVQALQPPTEEGEEEEPPSQEEQQAA